MPRNIAFERLSKEDERVLTELIRFGAFNFKQFARHYGKPEHKRLPRLERLITRRYVERKPKFPTTCRFYMATHRAVRAVQSDMQELKTPPNHPEHDLSVVNLADWLLEQNPGATWLTERELLQLSRKPKGWGRPPRGGHPPDGALVLDGRMIGIELERRFNGHEKYAKACRWFAEHIEFHEVRWYVLTQKLLEEIPKIVRAHGLDQDIQIVTLPIPLDVELVGWKRR